MTNRRSEAGCFASRPDSICLADIAAATRILTTVKVAVVMGTVTVTIAAAAIFSATVDLLLGMRNRLL